MARFIAIPVGHGDAFYLDRDGWSLLVDGGGARSGFAAMFPCNTRADGVNVAICTHNDADHANGVLGFLEAGLACEEMWLPGRWLGVLPEVLQPFAEAFVELADNVTQIETLPDIEERPDLPPIELYADHLPGAGSRDENPSGEDGPAVRDDGWPESYIPVIERAEPWESNLFAWPSLSKDWPRRKFLHSLYRIGRRLTRPGVQLLLSAIEAAQRIRSIAIEAFHRGIPIRWFEFDVNNPQGGEVGTLEPVNSREIARVQPRIGTFLDWLALTVANKESLVFWSPATDNYPGVLFTADSDLSGAKLPPDLSGAIATAPHHGAESNRNAYAEVQKAASGDTSSITWVRSDGKNPRRPGQTYIGLSSRRLCTRCRLSGGHSRRPQAVQLFVRSGIWTRHRRSAVCSCQ